jgi:hypothetical protein
MRFMMLVKADKDSEAGVLPDKTMLSEMGKYNEALLDSTPRGASAGRASARSARSSSRRTFQPTPPGSAPAVGARSAGGR